MKKSSLRAQMVKRTFCLRERRSVKEGGGRGSVGEKSTHFVGVVEM